MHINVLKFVTRHNFFYRLLQSCLSMEVYVFYIYNIYEYNVTVYTHNGDVPP